MGAAVTLQPLLTCHCTCAPGAWTRPQNHSQHSPRSGPYQSLQLVLKLESLFHASSPSREARPTKPPCRPIPVFLKNVLGIFHLVCFPSVLGPKVQMPFKRRPCLSSYQVEGFFPLTRSCICIILMADHRIRHEDMGTTQTCQG